MCLCCLRVCVWARAPPLSSNKGGSWGGRGPCGRARPCPAPPPCCVSRVRPVGGAVATRVYPKLSRIPCVFTWVCVCVYVRARWGEGDKHTAAGQPGLALGPSPGALAACLPGPALGRRQEEEQELSQSLGLRAQESPGRVKTGVPWRSSMGWARGLARLPGAR